MPFKLPEMIGRNSDIIILNSVMNVDSLKKITSI